MSFGAELDNRIEEIDNTIDHFCSFYWHLRIELYSSYPELKVKWPQDEEERWWR